MPGHLGPIDVSCDAPSYPIVKACSEIGFVNPLDVRWCHVGHNDGEPPWSNSFTGVMQLFGLGRPKKGCCGCGEALPLLERCTFTFASDRSIDYLIGQCPSCKAIYWQEAPVAEPSFDW